MLKRTSHVLHADPARVIAKPYLPGEEIFTETGTRAGLLMARILALPEDVVARVLDETLRRVQRTAPRVRGAARAPLRAGRSPGALTPRCRESDGCSSAPTSRTNTRSRAPPCSTPRSSHAPDHGTAGAGNRRFIMSLRAVGEGHISSIEFRTGVDRRRVAPDLRSSGPAPRDRRSRAAGDVRQAVVSRQAHRARRRQRRRLGRPRVRCPSGSRSASSSIRLGALEREGTPHAISYETVKIIRVLAASSYVMTFPADSALSERVIFPAGPHETHGMEDARFVRFVDDDGSRDVLRDLHGVRRLRDHAAADRDARLRFVPRRDARGPGGAEQGNGAVPAPDRGQVRDALATRSREPAPRDLA